MLTEGRGNSVMSWGFLEPFAMAIVDISGAYESHIHSDPSLSPPMGDDRDLGPHAEQAGLSGILLKNHFESTVGSASTAR